MSSMFLTPEEMAQLTGYKRHGKQIEALRQMGIVCRVNPAGRPIVARAGIEGAQAAAPAPAGRRWQSGKVKK